MKVGLIGGTFNPITKSHMRLALNILDLNLVDEVWFVPNDKHPFRDIQKSKANVTPFEDRVRMIHLAISAYPSYKKYIKVCDIDKGTDHITKDTIQALQKIHNHEFFWVLGTDCVNEWHKWREIDWLLENVNFIVYPRAGYTPIESNYWNTLREKHIVLTDNQVSPSEGSSTEARANPDGGLLYPSVALFWKYLEKKKNQSDNNL